MNTPALSVLKRMVVPEPPTPAIYPGEWLISILPARTGGNNRTSRRMGLTVLMTGELIDLTSQKLFWNVRISVPGINGTSFYNIHRVNAKLVDPSKISDNVRKEVIK